MGKRDEDEIYYRKWVCAEVRGYLLGGGKTAEGSRFRYAMLEKERKFIQSGLQYGGKEIVGMLWMLGANFTRSASRRFAV